MAVRRPPAATAAAVAKWRASVGIGLSFTYLENAE
jgi:hypothetical protein